MGNSRSFAVVLGRSDWGVVMVGRRGTAVLGQALFAKRWLSDHRGRCKLRGAIEACSSSICGRSRPAAALLWEACPGFRSYVPVVFDFSIMGRTQIPLVTSVPAHSSPSLCRFFQRPLSLEQPRQLEPCMIRHHVLQPIYRNREPVRAVHIPKRSENAAGNIRKTKEGNAHEY